VSRDGRSRRWWGAALVAIAVAAYLFRRRTLPDAGAALTSIAVRPFDDMSPGGDQKWLADGMAEELIETLSQLEALRCRGVPRPSR
jgi:TolB-like protein